MIFLIDHHAECLVAIDDDGTAFTSRSLLATDEVAFHKDLFLNR